MAVAGRRRRIRRYAVVVIIPQHPTRTLAYLGAIAAVLAATIGTVAIYDWIEPSISLLFFPAVLVPAMYGGYGPGMVATVLSTIILAYFFVPPPYSFYIRTAELVQLIGSVFLSFASA